MIQSCIDRSEAKKVFVSEDKIGWVQRYIVEAYTDGRCMCVQFAYEGAFENDEYFRVRSWSHYKEMKE